jgi:hypothetical protein
LILDEPFVGSDPTSTRHITNALEITKSSGVALIIISHQTAPLESLNPEVVVDIPDTLSQATDDPFTNDRKWSTYLARTTVGGWGNQAMKGFNRFEFHQPYTFFMSENLQFVGFDVLGVLHFFAMAELPHGIDTHVEFGQNFWTISSSVSLW